MAKKNKNMLQLNSFKNWQLGSYRITQYKRLLFVISKDGRDVWNCRSLRSAVKYSVAHEKAAN